MNLNRVALANGCLAILGVFYLGSWLLFKTQSTDFIIARRQADAEQIRRAPPAYPLGSLIHFASGAAPAARPYQTRGWSIAESWGAWTDGPEAELALRLTPPPAEPTQLMVRIEGFMTDRDHPVQVIDIIVNDFPISTLALELRDMPLRHEAIIPADALPADGYLRLMFRIHSPMSPSASGHSRDRRLLGAGISLLQIGADSPPVPLGENP